LLDALANSITVFDKAAGTLADGVDAAVQSVSRDLSALDSALDSARDVPQEENPEGVALKQLSEIAGGWEANWARITHQIADLAGAIEGLEAEAEPLFEELEALVEGIHDKALRKTESQRNKEFAEEWLGIVDAAKEQLARAQEIRLRGEDFKRVLFAWAVRIQISAYAETLGELTDEASGLAAELHQLAEDANALTALMRRRLVE
jgi:Rad3-related DNA helicase